MRRSELRRKYHKRLYWYKVYNIIQAVGCVVSFMSFLFLLGVVGTSDFEVEIGEILHPESWYTVRYIIGLIIMFIGCGICNVSSKCLEIIGKWLDGYEEHFEGDDYMLR